jgi:tRNA-dihydrouridine synthase B
MTSQTLLSTPLRIGSVELRNRAFLAPLSGITDRPMRERAYAHGAGLVVSEMVASGELAKGRAGSVRRIERSAEGPHMVQLAGRDGVHMAEAARIAAGEGADIIDINMGCPAKKVTGGYCGSALMREPDQAIRLVEAVVGAVSVPVTVKMRLGWDDDCLNAPDVARRAVEAGVQMITVHGRTRCQFYTGQADWRAVARVRGAISVPLVVNGDIQSVHDADAALALSGADAVMIGRGHYGRPWLAGLIAGGAGSSLEAPSGVRLADYVIEHYEAMLALYGTEQGLRHARKHSGWYLDRHAPETDDELRTMIMTAREPARVIAGLRQAFDPDRVPHAVGRAA